MAIDLSEFELGAPFDGDYSDALTAVQERLAHLHARHIIHDCRTIIVVEGWDAAGKGGVIKRLTSGWDPRYFQVWPIAAPTPAEKDRHFLWRFWQKLPGKREIAIFDRSWYGRVLVERVEGFATEEQWRRGYDQINEFEAQQIESGTNIIKLFFHVTQKEQDRRFRDRLEKPHKRWKITAEDFRNRDKRAAYLAALDEMFVQTDTRWAPWQAIDSNDKKAARIKALTAIADALEEKVPANFPELSADIAQLAQSVLGVKQAK